MLFQTSSHFKINSNTQIMFHNLEKTNILDPENIYPMMLKSQ